MDSDVIIVGGGLNGCTLALALAQHGVDVTLIDALPAHVQTQNNFDGRSYALSAASSRILKALDLWDDLHENAQPMNEIKVTQGHAGAGPDPFWMHFDNADLGEGPMGYMVEDRFLRQALQSAVEQGNLEYLPATKVTSQHTNLNECAVTVDNGRTLTAQLIVGADGRASGTARRAGLRHVKYGYDQSSLVCAIEHDAPHNGIAHQFFMPSGPLAILPLTGNRSSIVWTETTKNAQRINALSDAEYLAVLKPRFGDFLGDITLAGARYTYPLGLNLAYRVTADRVVLIGDAAHGVHPIAGQGLNAGLKDVAALAQVLVEHTRRGMDIGTAPVLDAYQIWRGFDVATLAMATDGFNRLFSNNNPILRGIRSLGMGVIGASKPMQTNFMREAAGLTGELPNLAQGKPI